MNVITDYDIQAFLDDELDHETACRVRSFIEENPTYKKRYNELLRQKRLLKSWWKNSDLM